MNLSPFIYGILIYVFWLGCVFIATKDPSEPAPCFERFLGWWMEKIGEGKVSFVFITSLFSFILFAAPAILICVVLLQLQYLS